MNDSDRIRQLEQELENERLTAASFADDIASIIIPFRAGDAIATGKAIQRISERHYAVFLQCQAVH